MDTEETPMAKRGEGSAAARELPLRRVSRPTLAEEAVKSLRHSIVRGDMLPGERLSEPELCEALGISRTPLREALKRLAAEGLVELRRNRNAVVAPMDPEQLAHLFEAEAGIEAMAAELATQRMTNTEIKRLEALQERMERIYRSGDLDSYFGMNQKVHGMIVAGARNPVLQETHSLLLGRLERARYMALSQYGRQEASMAEHRLILEAIKQRDPAAVRRLMMDHVSHTGDVITEICNQLKRRRARS